MVHRGQLLSPCRLGGRDDLLAGGAAGIAGIRAEFLEQAGGHLLGVADDADGYRLGQADAVRVDVDLNDLGVLRPVVDAVARQGRERVQARAERQHDIGLGDQLHAGLRAVIAERAGEQRVRTREGVIVLVAAADRGVETLGQFHRFADGAADDNAGTVQHDREFRLGQHLRGGLDGVLAACRALELDDGRKLDIDHLGPEIARHIDLGRGRGALGLQDHAVQRLGDAGRIANLFLIGNHVLEQGHLLDFLEAALTDGLVGGLRRDQQQRGVVPVGGLDRCHEIGDARTVLGDHHRHLAGGAGEAVGHHAGVALMCRVPEGDACLREQVGNGHHRRTDNAEGMLDAMHLQNLNESLFCRHLHDASSFHKSVLFILVWSYIALCMPLATAGAYLAYQSQAMAAGIRARSA